MERRKPEGEGINQTPDFDVEALEQDKQRLRRIPRVEVPPVRKKKKIIKEERMKSIQHGRGEVISNSDAPTDTTAAMEAGSKCEQRQSRKGGKADGR